MKRVKAILLTILSAYVLLVSCGFTVSHIYCQKGERWVIGSEMPPCKYPADSRSCSKKNTTDKHDGSEDGERQKDTYLFLFDFEAQIVAYNDLVETLDSDSQPLQVGGDKARVSPYTRSIKGLLRPHGFLEHSKPDLARLQVFRI